MDAELASAVTLAAVMGLLIGSFLNVVIHRLPKMMERQWALEAAAFQAEQSGADIGIEAAKPQDTFNLMVPRSRCPSCGHLITWYENIPVISYLFLRGKCAGCRTPISPRYPAVELATGALFFFCIQHWGANPAGVAWCAFSAVLITLAFIDWDTTLLPDDLTLPLLWGGLLASAMQWTQVPLQSAVFGAIAGYMSLWLVYWAFKLATGKEGMGYGDFKLFAALGAWFGWEALVPIILMSSVIGAIVGIALKIFSNLREGGYVPFGPFLAGAGFTAMVFGPKAILDTVLRAFGL
ncbi:A24 family peptidase [Acidovorax sp. DW039]|uniref:prepilin peptidase n=1 Tax=Acidovorax sp. DW039 TaxID=3095606 RepID=UPI003092582D|nr:A24 family peptidase [Acidovorax sp. DW039]